MASNKETIEKLYVAYFRELGFPSDFLYQTKIPVAEASGESGLILSFHEGTFLDYLASEASGSGVLGILFDLVIKGISTYSTGLPVSLGETIMGYVYDRIHEALVSGEGIDFEEIATLGVSGTLGIVTDSAFQEELDLKGTFLNPLRDRFLQIAFNADFDENNVFNYLNKSLKMYSSRLLAASSTSGGDTSLLDTARLQVDGILQHERDNLPQNPMEKEEFLRQKLEKEYAEFVEAYMSTNDFYCAIVEALLPQTYNPTGGKLEYYFWNKKADSMFHDVYKELKVDGDNANGIDKGMMASFRQAYSSVMWYLKVEGQTAPYSMRQALQVETWNNDLNLCRMDTWNSHVGFLISKDLQVNGNVTDEELNNIVARAVKEAMDSNILAKSVFDPRLQALGGDSIYDYSIMQANAGNIFNSFSFNSIKNEDSFADIVDRALDVSTISSSLNANDTPRRRQTAYFWKEEVHELLQLVNLTEAKSICDPAGDPFPDSLYPDVLDEEIPQKYSDAGWISPPFGSGDVSAKVFREKNGSGYYLVFKNSADLDQVSRLQTQEHFDGFEKYLNAAYECYRAALAEYDIAAENITLLGYSGAGALATALAAALDRGAFREDLPGTLVRGQYDGALAAYGWSLDDSGRLIDNYPAESVRALVFSSHDVGNFFRKPELKPEPASYGNNTVDKYIFDSTVSETDAYLDNLNDLPVRNYRLVADTSLFLETSGDITIGSNRYLGRYDGKLKAYINEHGDGTAEWWHSLDALFLCVSGLIFKYE